MKPKPLSVRRLIVPSAIVAPYEPSGLASVSRKTAGVSRDFACLPRARELLFASAAAPAAGAATAAAPPTAVAAAPAACTARTARAAIGRSVVAGIESVVEGGERCRIGAFEPDCKCIGVG